MTMVPAGLMLFVVIFGVVCILFTPTKGKIQFELYTDQFSAKGKWWQLNKIMQEIQLMTPSKMRRQLKHTQHQQRHAESAFIFKCSLRLQVKS
jgi:hypothetical protein